MTPLSLSDFPLYTVGSAVFSPSRPAAIFHVMSDAIAADIVNRLNRDHYAQFGTKYSRPEAGSYIGGGMLAIPASSISPTPLQEQNANGGKEGE